MSAEIIWGTLYGIASLGYPGTVDSNAPGDSPNRRRALPLGWRTKVAGNR